jgi:hypothetical protein
MSATDSIPQPLRRILVFAAGLLSNLLFLGLLVLFLRLIQPMLLDHLLVVYKQRQVDVGLGIFLLIIPLLELGGYWLVRPRLVNRIRLYKNESIWNTAGSYFFVLMMRGLVEMLWGFFAIASFGMRDLASPVQCIFGPVLLGIIFLKFALMMILIYQLISTPADKFPEYSEVPWKGWLGDVLLNMYSLLAFCFSWDFMEAVSPPHMVFTIGNLAGLVIFYSWCYFPSRSFAVLEEWLVRRKPVYLIVSFVIFAAGLVYTIGPILAGGN